jgi:hypothetical protein
MARNGLTVFGFIIKYSVLPGGIKMLLIGIIVTCIIFLGFVILVLFCARGSAYEKIIEKSIKEK